MSEGNLRFVTYEKAVKLIEEESDPSLRSTTLLIKSKEKKSLFINKLKSKLHDAEVCVLDSRNYRFGKRVRDDVSDYANDLKGIPTIIDGRTVFPGSIDLPKEGSCKENGILIFDEVSSSDESTQAIINSLLDTRKILSYELPKGWSIIVILDSLDSKINKILNRVPALGIE